MSPLSQECLGPVQKCPSNSSTRSFCLVTPERKARRPIPSLFQHAVGPASRDQALEVDCLYMQK